MKKRKGAAIINLPLSVACILYAACVLLLTTCYLEGDIEALRPTGSGTKDDPYYVRNVETLQKVGTGKDGWDKDKWYKQIAHIDLSSVANWEPICNESEPFEGNYNGQGFLISNLVIKSSADNQGLFGVIGKDGKVEYVNLAGVDISGYDNTNTGTVAGLNYGTVTNCCSTGSVIGYDYVGGIVGKNDAGDGGNSKIENCYSTCNVTGTNNFVGGVAGANSGVNGTVTVSMCYSAGSVSGNDYVGGLIGILGSSSCNIERCAALGPGVTSPGANIGRIAGGSVYGPMDSNYARSDMRINDDGPVIEGSTDYGSSYKHGLNVGIDSYDGGSVGYHDMSFWENLLTLNWDFNNTWEMHPNTKLPILKGIPDGTQNPETQYFFPLTDLETIFIYLSTRNGGNNTDNAIYLEINIDFEDMEAGSNNWQKLLDILAETDVYVKLDLSECDMDTGTFDPDINISDGKDKIVKLTLPGTADQIVAGSDSNGAFEHFTTLKSISGDNIGTIGSSAFKGCTALAEVIFPSADMIGSSAFNLCTSLKEVIFGMAYNIGYSAFDGCSALESVTLGWNIAPILGTGIFASNSSQTITVKVPLAATTYTPYPDTDEVSGDNDEETWANGFRGGGWNGTPLALIDSTLINQNITLKIEGN